MQTTTAPRPLPRPVPASQAGFSLMELLIGLIVMAEVLVVVLILFDVNNRVTRVQTQVAELQQSSRIAQHEMVRMARMAGRGGMPQFVAVEVDNNVAADTTIGTASDAPVVMEDTDILTLRGVFSSPIYQVDAAVPSTFILKPNANNPTNGTVIIDSISPSGIPQSLEAIRDADKDNIEEALVLVSPVNDSIYAVVEMTNASITSTDVNNDNQVDPGEERATVNFRISGGGAKYAAEYLALSPAGAFPPKLTTVAFVGVLEEYRYYIREDYAIEGDDQSEFSPKLSRARMFPGTDVPYSNQNANARVDIADNVMDLQVALGLDRGEDGGIQDTADLTADDWLFNHSGDDQTAAQWQRIAVGTGFGFARPLFYLRINTLTRTDRPDNTYRSPAIDDIEDRAYGEAADPGSNTEREERMHRRRLVQTVVDMRNI